MKTPCLPKISLFFILLVVSFSGFTQMRRIYLDGSGMNNSLRKISMINAAEGYFAFDLGAGFSGDSGRSITYRNVYLTGNVDYNGYSVNLTGGFQTSGVQAFSRDTFLLYGDFGQNPAILYSNNFGVSYTLIYQSQANTSQLTHGIQDMVFPQNINTGYAVEADRIIKSTDRGKTWFAVYTSTGSFFDFIEAIDDNTLFAFNTDGWTNKMVMTSDGGAHWRNVNLPTSQKINYASFISATKGWLSASENQSLYYTSNGGVTWTLKNNTGILPFFCTKMKFINDSTGYATTDQYSVLKTSDSGKIWEALPKDNAFSYLNNTHTELAFLNNNQFWTGGGQGFIEMTTNGGGITLPRALFTVDTTGMFVTGKVNLTNYGKSGYQYAWYKNNSLFSTTFNSSYIHGTYDAFDTIKLVVTKGNLTDSSIVPLYFIVPPKPLPATFSYFLPDSGSTGTTVSLVGANFAGVTSVLFGGVPASSFTIVNDTLIKAVVAGGATGSISIVTPVSTVTQNGFIYFTPLRITGFSPGSGPVGTIITIQGNQFSSNPTDNIVFIGGIRVSVLSSTPNTITVRAPAGTFYHEISVTVGGLTAISNIPFIVSYPGGAPVTKNSFPFRITFPYNYSDPRIASADLDGDGKVDLIMGQCVAFNWLSIMKNNSVQDSVSYVQVPTSSRPLGAGIDGSVTVADLDGDGRPDIIGGANFNGDGGELGIYRNTSSPGSIRFAPVINLASYSNTQILVCDLDGDGKPEIMGSAGGFTIYQNTTHDSTISFVHYTGPNIPSANGLAAYNDVDGDGKMDILISTTSGIEVYRNISNKSSIQFERFPTLSVLSTGFTGWPVFKIGDFDGDGRSDVLVLTDDTTATVLLNTSTTGNISFGLPYRVSAPNTVRGFGIGDLDGDGKADLSLASKKGFAFQNSSQPTNLHFANGIDLSVDSIKDVAIDMAHIDVNGDGKTDIVSLNSGPGYANTISVFLNQNPDVVSICAGTDTSLTSGLAGLNLQWQFKKDTSFMNIPEGGHFTGTTTATLQLKNMDSSYNGIIFHCVVDGTPGKSRMLIVNMPVMPSVTISSSDTIICPGSTAHFTARALNAGANPVYQWQINGHNIGANNMLLTTDSLRNQDTVRLILKPNLTCVALDSVLSNYFVIYVGVPQTPSVTIQSSDSVICSGSSVRFTAVSINPGTSPTYQWQVNGVNAGGDSSIFTTGSLLNGSNVSVILNSSITCSTLPSVSSNTISIQVNPVFTPGIQLTQITTGNICNGSPVQFSTLAQTGNGKPYYQWIKNGSPVGTDNTAYQDPSVHMSDQFYVVYYPHDICSLADSAVSNTITIITQQPASPAVFISGTTGLDSGTITSITAAVTNAGSSPVYQWQDSTQTNDWQALAGETGASLQFTPVKSGDKIRCRYSSVDICNTNSNIESNVLEFTLNAPADTMTVPAVPIDSGATVLKCYPNPVHSTLTVTGMKLIDQWQTLTIVNSSGQQVRTIDVRGQTTLYIPVDGLSNGLYFIVLKSAGSKTVKLKFLKG